MLKIAVKSENPGADLGGGGGADAISQEFNPLQTQRDTLWYFFRNPFLADRPYSFYRGAFGANKY